MEVSPRLYRGVGPPGSTWYPHQAADSEPKPKARATETAQLGMRGDIITLVVAVTYSEEGWVRTPEPTHSNMTPCL